MQQSIIDIFFALLRYSLEDVSSRGEARDLPITEPLSDDDWKRIFAISKKQALIGIIYSAVQRLPRDLQPPKELMDKWNQIVRQIIIRNTRMNATAAQLTQMFEEKGRKTVILKGQANALLYPEPLLRQAGDIDILVEGGRKHVLKLLHEMGVMEGSKNTDVSNHHVHLDSNKIFNASPNVTVEVHFIPTYNQSPFTTRNMLRYFDRELSRPGAVKLSSDGFNIPPMAFAMVMQLSHLQRHFYNEGIGFRQLMDYHLVLKNSTLADRELVRANLSMVGLRHIAGATMFVMGYIFNLPETHMLCEPDKKRGQQLLANILKGGNFGKHSKEQNLSVMNRWLADRMRPFKRFSFDFTESLWHEYRYIIDFVRYMPKRIRYGKISVKKV